MIKLMVPAGEGRIDHCRNTWEGVFPSKQGRRGEAKRDIIVWFGSRKREKRGKGHLVWLVRRGEEKYG